MTEQRELFDICANNHKGNPHSVAANAKIHVDKRPMREKIYDLIAHRQHPTCEEIEIALGLKHQSVSARISELKRAGRIIITGERETLSGCMAATYGVSDDKA